MPTPDPDPSSLTVTRTLSPFLALVQEARTCSDHDLIGRFVHDFRWRLFPLLKGHLDQISFLRDRKGGTTRILAESVVDHVPKGFVVDTAFREVLLIN